MPDVDKEQPAILIIDDEETMRDACVQALRKVGYRTETARDGLEGLEKARSFKPDVALVDLKMPGLSGMDVLLKLKEVDPEIVPVIITGYATVNSAVEGMKRGAFDFLPKPFTPDELRLIVARAAERRRIVREVEKLRREKKLMEDSFITMVSHQMRSPLVSVTQYFEAILDGGAGELNERQREILLRVKERLEGMMQLIGDWLNMARMNKEDLAARFENVSLPDMIQGLAGFMANVAEKKTVTIHVARPPGLPAIRGDRQSLEQVFTNLLSNAINYNRPGGSVSVDFKDDGERMCVEVSDTGIGIEKEHIPRLFQEFYRVKQKDGEKTVGTGLGLAIAKKIIEAHGGSIAVESVPGQGTTFTVILPKSP
jgi:two-component system sensor histidine kinase/response regulator